MSTHIRPSAVLLVLSIILVACSTATPTPEASSMPPDATASAAEPTLEPTTTPVPTPVPAGEVAELHASPDPLPPGTYTREGFTPQVTFTLDEGWQAHNMLNGFFDVQQDAGTPDVIALQFARPTSVRGDGGGGVSVTRAQEAADVLGANTAFVRVGDLLAVEVGGLPGVRITIENQGSADAGVMQVPPGPLGISPERRLQVTFIDTDDGLLAMLVGGSVARWRRRSARSPRWSHRSRSGPDPRGAHSPACLLACLPSACILQAGRQPVHEVDVAPEPQVIVSEHDPSLAALLEEIFEGEGFSVVRLPAATDAVDLPDAVTASLAVVDFPPAGRSAKRPGA